MHPHETLDEKKFVCGRHSLFVGNAKKDQVADQETLTSYLFLTWWDSNFHPSLQD